MYEPGDGEGSGLGPSWPLQVDWTENLQIQGDQRIDENKGFFNSAGGPPSTERLATGDKRIFEWDRW